MVSISGRPAATSEPKASTRIAIVTGQEMNSDLSIASRFAWLKSDHMPEAPVRLTVTPGPAAPASFVLEAVGSVDHRVRIGGGAGTDHRSVAVGEIERPGCGGRPGRTAGSRRRTPATGDRFAGTRARSR